MTHQTLSLEKYWKLFPATLNDRLKLLESYCLMKARDHEVREHIPVPYDNLFQSILSYASRSPSYF